MHVLFTHFHILSLLDCAWIDARLQTHRELGAALTASTMMLMRQRIKAMPSHIRAMAYKMTTRAGKVPNRQFVSIPTTGILYDRLELFLLENDLHGGVSFRQTARRETSGWKILLVSIVHNSVTNNEIRITTKPRDGVKKKKKKEGTEDAAVQPTFRGLPANEMQA